MSAEPDQVPLDSSATESPPVHVEVEGRVSNSWWKHNRLPTMIQTYGVNADWSWKRMFCLALFATMCFSIGAVFSGLVLANYYSGTDATFSGGRGHRTQDSQHQLDDHQGSYNFFTFCYVQFTV